MPKIISRSSKLSSLDERNGFILLEVLVAMSIVASSWIGLGSTYQSLILRLGHLQDQRTKMKQELDQHERALFTSKKLSNINTNTGTNSSLRKLSNESTRVSRRSRTFSHSGGAPH